MTIIFHDLKNNTFVNHKSVSIALTLQFMEKTFPLQAKWKIFCEFRNQGNGVESFTGTHYGLLLGAKGVV